MSSDDQSQFSAVDATLGYLYQIRSALLWSLRKLKTTPNFLVSVETADDVVFDDEHGEPADLIQAKHHLKRPAKLTDASPDLWKTLRVWADGTAEGSIPATACLYLVTTGAVAKNSAASHLLSGDNRDVNAARASLDSTAATSKSKSNAKAYTAYLRLKPSDRDELLRRVVVIDNSPLITDLDGQLSREVFWAAEKEHLSAFLIRLEGWWLRRVVKQLTDTTSNRIGSTDIEAKMSDLREQFKQDALPIDDDLIEFVLEETMEEQYGDFVFVRQLDLIAAGKRRIAAAIRDYYRAYEQRSRWLREDLVGGLDLHKYEKRLEEEWELVFEAMRDELGEEATNDAKERAARSVLKWAESATIPIRPSVSEPFLTRGSLHMLSDETRIGWHPEFRDLLESVLKRKEES